MKRPWDLMITRATTISNRRQAATAATATPVLNVVPGK